MTLHHYRIVNVFGLAGQPFSGNPLCVFEDARGLDDATMQALARQFNLSETTFLWPSERAHARARIFMPHVELPFAGHPTLGSAYVEVSGSRARASFRCESTRTGAAMSRAYIARGVAQALLGRRRSDCAAVSGASPVRIVAVAKPCGEITTGAATPVARGVITG